jgi:hypothetical protein
MGVIALLSGGFPLTLLVGYINNFGTWPSIIQTGWPNVIQGGPISLSHTQVVALAELMLGEIGLLALPF